MMIFSSSIISFENVYPEIYKYYYNDFTNKNKDNNKSKDKIKNNYIKNDKKSKSKRKSSNKGNQKKNKRKSMYNIQYNQQSSETGKFLDSSETMYQDEMNYFKIPKNTQIKTEKFNNVQNVQNEPFIPNQQENHDVWIFDINTSEHLTNNKTILINNQEKKVVLRCADNSLCEFEG